MDTPPVLRALAAWRLVAVSTTVLALGSGAHVLGGGHAPEPGVLALLGALVLLASAVVARRPLSLRVLLPVALLGQLGVHVALSWLGGPGATGGSPLVVAGHHAVDPLGVGAPTAPGEQVSGLVHGHPGAGAMLAAHVVAMAATVVLLVATDRGVLGLVRRWVTLLPVLVRPAGVVAPLRPRPVPDRVAPARRPVAHRSGTPRRGPPAGLRHRTAAA